MRSSSVDCIGDKEALWKEGYSIVLTHAHHTHSAESKSTCIICYIGLLSPGQQNTVITDNNISTYIDVCLPVTLK